MKVFFSSKLLLLVLGLFVFCPPIHASPDWPKSYLVAGIGLERLTYKEQIPDLDLTSSETGLTNLILHLAGRKTIRNYFIGAKGYIPISTDEARETWTSGGEFEQANSLTYRWTRFDAHVGYILARLLNPYIGIGWSYAEQERSNFENTSTPGLFNETATENVKSFSALIGIQGDIPLTSGWSLSYTAEYMLPFYSTVTNDRLPGWEVSNTEGYSYTLSGRLHYLFSETVSAILEVNGGRHYWEGSDWIPVGDSRVKWPENDTRFIGGFFSISKHF